MLQVCKSTSGPLIVCLTSSDALPDDTSGPQPLDQRKARALIEKKTVINLLEAFAISVKHYLRGEEGIFYEDLYHLVKFLPAYALPKGIGSTADFNDMRSLRSGNSPHNRKPPQSSIYQSKTLGSGVDISARSQSYSAPHLPLPASPTRKQPDFLKPVSEVAVAQESLQEKPNLNGIDDEYLLPSRIPPKYGLFDFFPFSLLVRRLTKRGVDVKGKKAARMRAKLKGSVISHNIPLEISLYLVCVFYVSGPL
jgi:ion channel-forming bestrophin family protein